MIKRILMAKQKGASLPIPTIGVSAVVLNNDDAVLMVCRNKAPAYGQWSIPGGRMEPGESLIYACQREVMEETGIDVEVNNILAVAERRVENFHYVIVDFLATLKHTSSSAPFAQTDVSDARWISVNELDDLDLVDGLEEIIRRAYRYYQKGISAGLMNTDGKGTDFIAI